MNWRSIIMRCYPYALGILMLATLWLALSAYLMPTKLVSFNLAKVRGQFIYQLAELKLSAEKVKEKSARFTNAMRQVLTNYAKTKRVVIMAPQNLLAGADDVTAEIASLIALEMRGKHAI